MSDDIDKATTDPRVPCPACGGPVLDHKPGCDRLPLGTRVVVTHTTGIIEAGTVRGRTNPAMFDDAEFGLYDIEFEDRTRMAVSHRIVRPCPEDVGLTAYVRA